MAAKEKKPRPRVTAKTGIKNIQWYEKNLFFDYQSTETVQRSQPNATHRPGNSMSI